MNRNFEFRIWDNKLLQFDSPNVHHLIKNHDRLVIGLNLDILKIAGPDRFVIQEWTGLTDISGKKIFEGDILVWARRDGQTYQAPVVFSPTAVAFVLDSSGRHLIDEKYGDYVPMSSYENYKIVGNIFEK